MTIPNEANARPIFVQAMWRTGSTYVWEKFRAQKRYRAYYEPLHELLLRRREEVDAACGADKRAELRHSSGGEFYFAEYPFRPGGGVEFFRKELSYERYGLGETENDEDLRRYIANLMEHAARGGQQPVFQFNRALLRAGWLARHFNSTQILVLRHPREVWKSFASFAGNPFETRICAILGQNKNRAFVKELPAWMDFPERICETFEEECNCYDPFAAEHKELLYAPFFDFYLLGILHCAQYADCILDLDAITRNAGVRRAATERLRELGMGISLEDCALPFHGAEAGDEEWRAFERFSAGMLKKRLPREISLSWAKLKLFSPLLGDYFKNLLAGFTERSGAGGAEEGADRIDVRQGQQESAIRLYAQADFKGASNLFGNLLAGRETGELWNDWATAQNACGRARLAELGFRRALSAEPAYGEAEAGLGVVLCERGKFREALPFLERAELEAGEAARGKISAHVDRARAALCFSGSGEKGDYGRKGSGFTVFFTGLSGAGKSTLAENLMKKLGERGEGPAVLLDGDSVRRNLSSELGFSKEHRDLNIRRMAFVASLITRSGGIAVCAAIAPYDAARKQARRMVEAEGRFYLVHVATPLEVCEARDPKGLYAQAREGVLPQFTGISDPYEEPCDAEVCIDTVRLSEDTAAEAICEYLFAPERIVARSTRKNGNGALLASG